MLFFWIFYASKNPKKQNKKTITVPQKYKQQMAAEHSVLHNRNKLYFKKQ